MTETTVLKPIDEIRQNLVRLTPEFEKVLPKQIPVDKFVRVVQTAITTNPKLIEADRSSLWSACVKCATDGLLPDGREAALVTFRLKSGIVSAQYMPMVTGILKKVRNSGELSNITSAVVYEADEFDYWIDENGDHMKHKPKWDVDRGSPKLTYAIARTKDGAVYLEVMREDQIQDVKSMSRAKEGPWDGPFADEMRRKTVIRRLSKRLPMSTDLEVVMERDNDLYDLKPAREPALPAKQTPKLQEIVKKDTLPPTKEPEKKPVPVPDAKVENIKKTFDATEVKSEGDPNAKTGEIEGVIADFRSKSGKKANGSPWTRWAVCIEKKWMGTFSETHAGILSKANSDKTPVKIGFSIRIDNNTKYFDIEEVVVIKSDEEDHTVNIDEEGESLI